MFGLIISPTAQGRELKVVEESIRDCVFAYVYESKLKQPLVIRRRLEPSPVDRVGEPDCCLRDRCVLRISDPAADYALCISRNSNAACKNQTNCPQYLHVSHPTGGPAKRIAKGLV